MELAHAPNIAQYITAAAPVANVACPVTANGMVTHHGHRPVMRGIMSRAKPVAHAERVIIARVMVVSMHVQTVHPTVHIPGHQHRIHARGHVMRVIMALLRRAVLLVQIAVRVIIVPAAQVAPHAQAWSIMLEQRRIVLKYLL